jgi:hypothetical protein
MEGPIMNYLVTVVSTIAAVESVVTNVESTVVAVESVVAVVDAPPQAANVAIATIANTFFIMYFLFIIKYK